MKKASTHGKPWLVVLEEQDLASCLEFEEEYECF
jgi:hypothetical protein